MAKGFAKIFYNSARWKRCRNSYIQQRIMIDGGMCEECHEQAGFIVHHKITLDESNINNPDITLNYENLSYVCKDCHDRFEGHGVGRAAKGPTVIFNEKGEPIGRLEERQLPP